MTDEELPPFTAGPYLGQSPVGMWRTEAADDIINPPRSEEAARVLSGEEAIAGADIPTLDPATMVDAEIAKVLGSPAQCTFRYTSAGKPILALKGTPGGTATTAVLKVNAHLVELQPAGGDGNLVLTSGPISVTLSADDVQAEEKVEADMVFAIGESLRVGYSGYYQCGG